MANTFNPFGFDPASRMDGAAWSGNQTAYQILYSYNTALYRGDPVQLTAGYIQQMAPGSISSTVMPMGIFMGCQYISKSQQRLVFNNFWPGTADVTQVSGNIVTAFVIDDPNVTFWVQTGYSGSGSGPATQAMVGDNCTYAYGTPSAANLSGAYIDLTTAPAVGATLPFRILALPADPWIGAPASNGLDNTTQYNLVQVMWNNEFYRQLTGA